MTLINCLTCDLYASITKLCILVMHSSWFCSWCAANNIFPAIKYDFLDLQFDKQERQHRKFISYFCYGLSFFVKSLSRFVFSERYNSRIWNFRYKACVWHALSYSNMINNWLMFLIHSTLLCLFLWLFSIRGLFISIFKLGFMSYVG